MAGLVTAALAAAPAAAHNSAWTGHRYIEGKHWGLVYETHWNEYYGVNTDDCRYHHWHDVSHYYRTGPSDDFDPRHRRWHYIGEGNGCPAREHSGVFVGIPDFGLDPENDVPDTQLSAAFTSAQSPEQVAAGLQLRGEQTKFYSLDAAVETLQAPAGTVVTAVYEDPADASWVVEVASDELALRLGH